MPGFPVLKGRRIRLRAPVADDVAPVFALFSDPDTMRHWPRAPMRHTDEAAAYIAECAGHFEGGRRIDWIVALPHADTAIGTCTLYDIEAGRGASIGYALLPAHRGRGLATDAVLTATAWAFRTLALERVEATVEPDNLASQRLLARAGFARAAIDRYCLVGGSR
ncbi:GNAT family N-acetyltransferase [Noviluteimonas gilva]|uniref:GNAT family N-acetyltransferase n=1 Tax=Noviluteimonas gilva TaxID=2682097 RepID=A0A7C9HT88_9GAMM|nr:GNAT family N-acetyltransferase [Lysobacter gilvus]MUV12638.1 GNAT family N-acetyltransferase [Lysobacter gilvus]